MNKLKKVFILNSKSVIDRLIEKLRMVNPENSQHPTYKVTIEEHKEKRTLAQNKLMWFWMGFISTAYYEAGGKKCSDKVWHEYFKDQFLPTEIIELRGKFIPITKSTTELNTKEFTQYLESVDHYSGSELEIQLPQPIDLYYMAMGIKLTIER